MLGYDSLQLDLARCQQLQLPALQCCYKLRHCTAYVCCLTFPDPRHAAVEAEGVQPLLAQCQALWGCQAPWLPSAPRTSG